MIFLQELRKQRENLAQTLRDHPGIRRMVEDLYPDNAHFIYELLQNAEDAGARNAWFELTAGGLAFIHDGTRPFSDGDVKAITDIGGSSKIEDHAKIGKFGVGFKSVFAYTETPYVYSPTYCFRITQLVLPDAVDQPFDLNGRTRFEFPFNNPQKSHDVAYAEVTAGLEALAAETLLFLPQLHTISWAIENGSSGEISRTEHTETHVEVQRTIGGGTPVRTHWLRFRSPVEGHPTLNVAVAFELDLLPRVERFEPARPVGKQMKIVPAAGRVAVFFPAEKEQSGLRFHLHAPFACTVARDSVKDRAENVPLVKELARLSAQALHEIKAMGLLNTEFLGVLPNPEDDLSEFYAPIRHVVIHEMRTQPLTPTHTRGHAPAAYLVQGRAALKELIAEKDLVRLLEWEGDPPEWAAGAQQKNGFQDRFLNGLEIRSWDIEDFVSLLEIDLDHDEPNQDLQSWMREKDAEWHQRLYATLYQALESEYELYRLDMTCIVQCSDGGYCRGRDAYFPSGKGKDNELLARVADDVLTAGSNKRRQALARKFLEEVGVREVGEAEEVEAILNQRYTYEAETPDDETYRTDFGRFMALVKSEPARRMQLRLLFSRYWILKGQDDRWYKPSGLYLDVPYKKTLLLSYYDALSEDDGDAKTALSTWYKDADFSVDEIAAFAEAMGATVSLEISKVDVSGNPRRQYLWRAPGQRFTNYGVNRDYRIKGLQHLLSAQAIEASRLVWRTLDRAGNEVLLAVYRNNGSSAAHYAPSQLMVRLKDAEWIPQRGKEFVKPCDAAQELLPEGFPYDAGKEWLKAIGFGEELRKKSEEYQRKAENRKTLGFESEEELERAREFLRLPREAQLRALQQYQRASEIELPEHAPANPERRLARAEQKAREALERTAEKRSRSVQVGLADVKAQAEQYLRQQYTNPDGIMICQICLNELPFKKADDRYYFEKVELLSGLARRHHQNYLALCPNHGAMFQHANDSEDILRDMLETLEGQELEVVLARSDHRIWFTETHLIDLHAVLAAEEEPAT
jgi:hypothetical protein